MCVDKIKTPNIIGIYGLPGAGKTTLLSQLRQTTDILLRGYDFYEGSEVIDSVMDGGLAAFKKLPHADKQRHRATAVRQIGRDACNNGKSALVAGHFILPNDDLDGGLQEVYTEADLETFTHIVYLKVPAEDICKQCAADMQRKRASFPVEEVNRWQDVEVERLFHLCLDRGIVFATVSGGKETTVQRVADLCSFWNLSEQQNSDLAVSMASRMFSTTQLERCSNILVFDADRTLAPQDSGTLFVEKGLSNGHLRQPEGTNNVLKTVFGGPLGYTHRAFQQVSVMLESFECFNEKYDSICDTASNQITIYPEMITVLSQATRDPRVIPLVVTSGVRRVWEMALQRIGLQGIPIFGGGRVRDQYVVTPQTKATIVAWLATVNTGDHRRNVTVYGDSPLDIPMMAQAGRAFVIVGNEETRSSTMDSELEQAIRSGVFGKTHDKKFATTIKQILLPSNVTPRPGLPIAELQYPMEDVPVNIAPSTAAKLLASPMRDASIAGPALQEAHAQAGRFLATQVVAQVIGLEEHIIPHVQGQNTIGYRLKAEERTLIVAMMRGGEPMARGVYQTFPLAMFAFAKYPQELATRDVVDMESILLVDSVINTGKSMIDFVEYIRAMNSKAKILLVAGVVQAGAVELEVDGISEGGSLRWKLGLQGDVGIVALRVSENKYTGAKGTDTGNRLFNTTHWH
ncbi:hypothetical protein ACKVV7_003430 [Pyricularia oryzae]